MKMLQKRKEKKRKEKKRKEMKKKSKQLKKSNIEAIYSLEIKYLQFI
jgi:hypothetical protein